MSPIGQLLLSGRLSEATIGHLIKLSRPLSRFFHALSSPETSAWPVDTRYAAVPRLAGTEGQVRFLPSHSPATSSLLACHPSVPFFFSLSLTDVSRFLTGWVHGCSVLFWFLKVALSSHKHTTPLAPSAFQVSCSLTLQVIHTPPHLALLAGSGVGFASSRKREHLCVFYGGSLPTLIDDVRLCCRPPLLSSSQSNLCSWDFCDMGTVADLRTCSTLLLSMFIYHKPLPLSTAFRSS